MLVFFWFLIGSFFTDLKPFLTWNFNLQSMCPQIILLRCWILSEILQLFLPYYEDVHMVFAFWFSHFWQGCIFSWLRFLFCKACVQKFYMLGWFLLKFCWFSCHVIKMWIWIWIIDLFILVKVTMGLLHFICIVVNIKICLCVLGAQVCLCLFSVCLAPLLSFGNYKP